MPPHRRETARVLGFTAALAIALAPLGCNRQGSAEPAGASGGPSGPAGAAAAAAGSVPVLDLEKTRALLAGLKGNVAVVNLWAAWCKPCVREIPELDAFAKAYAGRVEVVAISMDDPSERDRALARLLAEKKPSFRVVMKDGGDFDAFRDLFDREWQGDLPTSFIYGRDGRVAARLVGAHRRSDFERAVEPLLAAR